MAYALITPVSAPLLAVYRLLTNLRGQIYLADRVLDLKADVSPAAATPAPAIVFDVTGRWQDVIITPDARSLIQRSGAAKPLFGPAPSVAPSSLATAQ